MGRKLTEKEIEIFDKVVRDFYAYEEGRAVMAHSFTWAQMVRFDRVIDSMQFDRVRPLGHHVGKPPEGTPVMRCVMDAETVYGVSCGRNRVGLQIFVEEGI